MTLHKKKNYNHNQISRRGGRYFGWLYSNIERNLIGLHFMHDVGEKSWYELEL